MNYYKNNLQKLGKLKKDDSIQICFEGKKTNYFALNKDSLNELKEFINNLNIK
jgi:hypothetical protein